MIWNEWLDSITHLTLPLLHNEDMAAGQNLTGKHALCCDIRHQDISAEDHGMAWHGMLACYISDAESQRKCTPQLADLLLLGCQLAYLLLLGCQLAYLLLLGCQEAHVQSAAFSPASCQNTFGSVSEQQAPARVRF